MIYQQRPFFRQKIKLNKIFFFPSTTSKIFLNNNKFNKNVKGSKLSPHKFKRTHLLTPTMNNLFTLFSNTLCFKIIFLELSMFNTITRISYKNHLGVIFKMLYLSGSFVNTILVQSTFYNHIFIHMDLMKPKLIGLNLAAGIVVNNSSKVYGLKSPKSLIFYLDGTINIALKSKQLITTTSVFTLGILNKFNSRNIGRVASVRGISKNPVDHPNGGRANTKGSFKTP